MSTINHLYVSGLLIMSMCEPFCLAVYSPTFITTRNRPTFYFISSNHGSLNVPVKQAGIGLYGFVGGYICSAVGKMRK